MSILNRLKNRTLAILTTYLPSLGERFVAGYQARRSEGSIPWAAPAKPLNQSRLAVVTTAGIHHRSQSPFDMNDRNGDPTFRELDGNTLFSDFQITHDYYDHSQARKDPNSIIPLERLRELVDEKMIGSLASQHYSFMGHIDAEHIQTLIEKTARDVAQKLKENGVDLVLLTPA